MGSQSKISGFFSPQNTPKISQSKVDNEAEEELLSPEKVANEERKRVTSGDSDDRPDSGFASRAETPAVLSEAGSKAGSPCKDADVKDEVEEVVKEEESIKE